MKGGQVTVEMTPHSEGLLTYWTLETLVVGMDPLVLLQSGSINKLVPTNITEMGLDAFVGLDMPPQVVLLGEHFITLITGKLPIKAS